MDWKKQFKCRKLSFRDTCIVLLVIAVCEFVLIWVDFGWFHVSSELVSSASCNLHEQSIYRIMCAVPAGEEFELPPDWTVADLIREAVGKDRQAASPLEEEFFSCRNISNVRSFPYLKRERVEVSRPYLVFPVPASVVFDRSLQQPVPILMCPPGAHGKYGSRVLYSDGSTKSLTAKEAEKLVAEQSPVPLEIQKPNDQTGQEAEP